MEDRKDLSMSTSTIEDPKEKMIRQAQGKNPTRQEKKKAQKAEAIAKGKFAARRSPRSRDVKVFYGKSSKEEEEEKKKKKPKPKPKMASPPKKCKIKVCRLKSFSTQSEVPTDLVLRSWLCTMSLGLHLHSLNFFSSDTAAKGKGKGRGKPINIPLNNISSELKKILVKEMVKGGGQK